MFKYLFLIVLFLISCSSKPNVTHDNKIIGVVDNVETFKGAVLNGVVLTMNTTENGVNITKRFIMTFDANEFDGLKLNVLLREVALNKNKVEIVYNHYDKINLSSIHDGITKINILD